VHSLLIKLFAIRKLFESALVPLSYPLKFPFDRAFSNLFFSINLSLRACGLGCSGQIKIAETVSISQGCLWVELNTNVATARFPCFGGRCHCFKIQIGLLVLHNISADLLSNVSGLPNTSINHLLQRKQFPN
jgi:hypothetical protein